MRPTCGATVPETKWPKLQNLKRYACTVCLLHCVTLCYFLVRFCAENRRLVVYDTPHCSTVSNSFSMTHCTLFNVRHYSKRSIRSLTKAGPKTLGTHNIISAYTTYSHTSVNLSTYGLYSTLFVFIQARQADWQLARIPDRSHSKESQSLVV